MVSAGGKVVVTENVHKEAALFHTQMIPQTTRAEGSVGFLGCELEWNVPEQTPRDLVSILLPPKASLLSCRLIPT